MITHSCVIGFYQKHPDNYKIHLLKLVTFTNL